MATPFATDDEAREFYAGENAGDLAVEVTMGLAVDAVQHGAPVPDPEPADYATRARNAELLVGRWLWQTKGFVSSKGLGALSTSFDVKGEAVQRIVAQSMGEYFTGGMASVGRVGYW